MNKPCIHFLREGQPKRLWAYTAAPVLLMGSLSVSAAPPTASFTADKLTGPVPLKVKLDASASTDPDNNIGTYWWLFFPGGIKDNLGTNTQHTNTFTTQGTYSIVLVVEDHNGEVGVVSKSVVVTSQNQPPVAAFTATPNDLTVNLDGSASADDGDIVSYQWQSGDKTTKGKTAILTFDNEGSYQITLTVTDNQGTQDSITQSVAVEKPNEPPVAAFTYAIVEPNFTVNLDGSSSSDDGNVTQYNWQSSDGQKNTGRKTSFIFPEVGDYEIVLTVTDDKSATDTTTQTVTVVHPAPKYNTTVRTDPQIIAAGVSPSLVDMSDDKFHIVALVRPGATAIRTVTFQDTTGALTVPAMTQVGTLANGDEFYQFTYSYVRGTIPDGTVMKTVWGSKDGQYHIVARGEGGEQSHTYPYLKIGNYPAIDSSAQSKKPATPLSYDMTIRYNASQVIMAGYSPAILDNSDTEFDVIAIVRPGPLPIESVTLKSDGLFQAGMTFAGDLGNWDKMYKFTYTFAAGALGNSETGYIEHKDLWGSDTGQFGIVVTDAGGIKGGSKFPDIEFGNNPGLKQP
jgi:PKD repeat protein